MPKKTPTTMEKLLSYLKVNESTLSTVLGALVVVIIGVLIFNYFKSSKPAEDLLTQEGQEVLSEGEVELITNENGFEVPKNLPTSYTVVSGDKLWDIAEKFYGSGYNWVDIANENGLTNADLLYVDQELTIPQVAVRKPAIEARVEPSITGATYTVQKGDSLWKVALMAYSDGYKWVDIASANDLMSNPGYIEVGQVLTLPR